MYIVKAYFEDALDEHHPYNAGDKYPRKGLSVSKKRLAELSSENNIRGIPLIEYQQERAKKEKVE